MPRLSLSARDRERLALLVADELNAHVQQIKTWREARVEQIWAALEHIDALDTLNRKLTPFHPDYASSPTPATEDSATEPTLGVTLRLL